MTDVTLGEETFTLLPQPHAYLLQHFPKLFGGLDGSSDVGGVMRVLGDKVYDALCLFMPGRDGLAARLPAYKFHGYPSVEAWQAGEYDEESARLSPTFPQIGDALEQAVQVNWGESLTKLLDPLALVTEMTTASLVTSSPILPSTNGASPSTSSGASPPTLTVTDLG